MNKPAARPPKVELLAIDKIHAFEGNSKSHPPDQVAALARSIREFGFTAPVLIDESGTLLAGHGRVMAAREVGLLSVPAIRVTHLTPDQKRAYVIADNRLTELGGWDEKALAEQIQMLMDAGVDVSVTGFDDKESKLLLAALTADSGKTDPNAVPKVQANPISRAGDVWVMGRHRLVCGDATDRDVIAALMQGDLSRLCFTSPPYGNQRDYTSGGISDWDGLMRGVFAHLPMAGDGQVLVNLGLIHRDNEVIPYWDGWLSWMRQQGWRRFAWYVWDQGPGMPGDWAGRFAPSFEFVFHFNSESRKPNKIVPCKHAGQESHLRADGSSTGTRGKDGEVGGWTHKGQPTQDTRIPDSVIRVMRHKGKIGQDIDHPAVFPVALPEFVIEAYTDAGDIVFEPFGGSGTTMLAAERTGRICRSVEIAPEYVDVIIRRWQEFTGLKAVHASDGVEFDEIATLR